MKITTELLQRYANNTCSEKERQAVELWLRNRDTQVPQITDAQWEKGNELIWSDIKNHISVNETPVIPLYKKVVRYAAAACFIIAVFFAGRLSTGDNTFIAQTNTEQQSNDLLVYGGDDTYAKISGDVFSLQFDGRLKLHNNSSSVKTVKVGNTAYTLQPHQTYYLWGNNHESSLIANKTRNGSPPDIFSRLKGDFSIKPYMV